MGKIQNFMMRQVLKHKLKSLPEAQINMILQAVEKNQDFFKSISEEIKKRTKSGQSETEATMQVMRERQNELQRIMQG